MSEKHLPHRGQFQDHIFELGESVKYYGHRENTESQITHKSGEFTLDVVEDIKEISEEQQETAKAKQWLWLFDQGKWVSAYYCVKLSPKKRGL